MDGYNIRNISTNKNQLHHEVVGLAIGLNNWAACDSASRLDMVGSHLSQMTVISGAEYRRIYSGIEREYGKATFKAEMPSTGSVLALVPKYTGGVGKNAIPASHNSMSYLIYQDLDAAERGEMILGVLELPAWHWLHQNYGFRFQPTADLKRIVENDILPKGRILAQSPNVCPKTNNYKFGRETKVVYMSVPGIIEDGYIVRRGLLKELSFKSYGKVMFGWGKKTYPVNIYGDENTFKSFPDVGEVIRPDGLLFASREYDPINAGVEMSVNNMRKVDIVADKTIYCPPGARIVDVEIKRNFRNFEILPEEMNEQAQKYHNAQVVQARKINDLCKRFKRAHNDVQLTELLHNLQVRNLIELGEYKKGANKTFRANLIDDWTVTVTYEKDDIPTVGYKITGIHGDKGVICAVWDDEDMPTDKHGTVADIIKDGDSTVKRMNCGAPYEHYCGAALDEADRRIRKMSDDGVKNNVIFEWLVGFADAFSPYYGAMLREQVKTGDEIDQFVEHELKMGVTQFLPPNSPTIGIQQIRDLNAYCAIDYGPVTYRGRSGNVITTKNDILIGSAITIVLEKTGSIWAAVSSARRQHFGFLTKLTNSNKLSEPCRPSPTRFPGEAEVKLMMAYTNARGVADILRIQNDPNAMRHLIRNRMTSDTPTAMDVAIDWESVGRGGHRGVNYVTNMLACSGIEYGRSEL